MTVDKTESWPLVSQVPQAASRWYSAVGLSWNVVVRTTVSVGYCNAYWPSQVLLIKAFFFFFFLWDFGSEFPKAIRSVKKL